jgi:hypothetical protein
MPIFGSWGKVNGQCSGQTSMEDEILIKENCKRH